MPDRDISWSGDFHLRALAADAHDLKPDAGDFDDVARLRGPVAGRVAHSLASLCGFRVLGGLSGGEVNEPPGTRSPPHVLGPTPAESPR